MNTRPASDEEARMWGVNDGGVDQARTYIGGPEEGDGVRPCPILVSRVGVTRVAYTPSANDLAALNNGGTLWFCSWGPLPVHQVIVSTVDQELVDE